MKFFKSEAQKRGAKAVAASLIAGAVLSGCNNSSGTDSTGTSSHNKRRFFGSNNWLLSRRMAAKFKKNLSDCLRPSILM